MTIYEAAPFFFIRQSLISKEDFEKIFYSSNKQAELFNYYENSPKFKLAIAIASPSLYQSLQAKKNKANKQLYLSLLKYFLRACSRTTPFGLFASIGYGKFAEKANLFLDNSNLVKKIRPDMTLIANILKNIIQNSPIPNECKLYSNPSIILKGSKFYLIQQLSDTDQKNIISISASLYSKTILELCSQPIAYSQLVRKLLESYGQEKRLKIEESIKILLDKNFLIPEIIPSMTDYNFIDTLPDKLNDFLNAEPAKDKLREFKTKSKEFESENNEILQLKRLEEIYNKFPPTTKMPYPAQIDSMIKGTACLPKSFAKQIEILPEILIALQDNQHIAVEKFHKDFLEIFGVDTLVPLKEAIREISFDQSTNESSKTLSMLDSLILQEKKTSISLSDEFIKQCMAKLETDKTPISTEIFFEIIGNSLDDFNSGNYTILLNPHLATEQAGSSLGRFLYLFNDSIYQEVKTFLKKEEEIEPEMVFAEASFIPISSRTANVAIFKPLREHHLGFEYPSEGSSSLYLDDIYLGGNLNEMYIFSKTLNKKVHLSLSTVVNENLAPLSLQLLLAISKYKFYKMIPAPWLYKTENEYFPEVKYKNIVLSPQRWLLSNKNLKLNLSTDQKSSLIKNFERLNISPYIFLCHYDQRLKLNWKDPDHFKIIYQQFRANNELVLLESIHENSAFPSKESKNCFSTEFVVSFVRKKANQKNKYPFYGEIYQHAKERKLDFSSNCLYAKIHIHQDQELDFLQQEITPLINNLTENKLLSHWFFIRYYEFNAHIRLRLFANNANERSQLYEKFSITANKWLEQGYASDISLHTYVRELERYGEEKCISSVEEFFCVDSILTIQILQKIKDHEFFPSFSIASISILVILDSFLTNNESCFAFLEQAKIDKSMLSGTRNFYKQITECVAAILDPGSFECKNNFLLSILPIFKSLHEYSYQLRKELNSADLSDIKLYKLLDSLIHMHCNRFLGIDNEIEKKARCFAEFIFRKLENLQKLSVESVP